MCVNKLYLILVVVLFGCCAFCETALVVIPKGMDVWRTPEQGFVCVANKEPLLMDPTEITKKMWDIVYSWSITNGYEYSSDVAHFGAKGQNHPIHGVTFCDSLKWINARSEMQGLEPCYLTTDRKPYRKWNEVLYMCDFGGSGFRLPTITEWEFAAFGGRRLGGRYPCGSEITPNDANYCLSTNKFGWFDRISCHPKQGDGDEPYTRPVASFKPNDYGLYDMAGNVAEWCWKSDFEEHGPIRDGVLKGGSWRQGKQFADVRYTLMFETCGRHVWSLGFTGFRCVRRCGAVEGAGHKRGA